MISMIDQNKKPYESDAELVPLFTNTSLYRGLALMKDGVNYDTFRKIARDCGFPVRWIVDQRLVADGNGYAVHLTDRGRKSLAAAKPGRPVESPRPNRLQRN